MFKIKVISKPPTKLMLLFFNFQIPNFQEIERIKQTTKIIYKACLIYNLSQNKNID